MVKMSKSIDEKVDLLQYFLSKGLIQDRKLVKVLNYLLNNESILEYVHFVTNAKKHYRSLAIDVYDSKNVQVTFKKSHLSTNDVEKAYHDIRMFREEDLFIYFRFLNCSETNLLYLNYAEEDFIYDSNEYSATNNILDRLTFQFNKKRLQNIINQKLDKKDEIGFLKYTNQLKRLEEQFNHQGNQDLLTK